jgi:hypothetical protein
MRWMTSIIGLVGIRLLVRASCPFYRSSTSSTEFDP